jgi:hypothetical protein
MPDDDGTMLKEMEMRRQQKLLACIKLLPIEGRVAFDKWYGESKNITAFELARLQTILP